MHPLAVLSALITMRFRRGRSSVAPIGNAVAP